MPRHFFILGKNPTLSIAEIFAVLKSQHVSFTPQVISKEVLVVETGILLEVEKWQRILGGTIKIGLVIQEINFDENEENFEKIFEAENIGKNFLTTTAGKVHFGISVYDGGTYLRYLKEMTGQLKTLNITIKENLKNRGLKPGFVRIKERFLSSVSVAKNKLLSNGAEIVLILTTDKILIAKTLTVQEFASFSFRDFGRPERDKKSGIMPPKLARMMINLAQIPQTGNLLDPFCGSGTIMQEAIILGYKNIIGSDISKKAFTDSMANTDWLFKHFPQLKASDYKLDGYLLDARAASTKFPPDSIDGVVTEPYLGPPLYKKPDLNTIAAIFDEISKLYLAAFREFYKIIKPKGKVVFLFPAFELMGRMHFLPILDKIEEIGFAQKELIPEDLKRNPVVEVTVRNTILYGSDEHFVKREITAWEKL